MRVDIRHIGSFKTQYLGDFDNVFDASLAIYFYPKEVDEKLITDDIYSTVLADAYFIEHNLDRKGMGGFIDRERNLSILIDAG